MLLSFVVLCLVILYCSFLLDGTYSVCMRAGSSAVKNTRVVEMVREGIRDICTVGNFQSVVFDLVLIAYRSSPFLYLEDLCVPNKK